MRKSNNKSLLSRFFSHDITLLVLAFLIAFSSWFIIKVTSGAETPKKISDIPITIELPSTDSSEQLKIFAINQNKTDASEEQVTAEVQVVGNPIVVAGLKPTDFKVSASQVTTVLNPGSYVLPLTAEKSESKSDYDFKISGLSPSNVTIFVDYEKAATFTVNNQINVHMDDEQSKTHFAHVSLSTTEVTVIGPRSQVNKIKAVAVKDDNLTDESQTLQEDLVYLDENGEVINDAVPYVTADHPSIEVTVTILPTKNVKLAPSFANGPSDYSDYDVSPNTMIIAGPQSALDAITKDTISVGDIDFSELKNEYYEKDFEFDLPDQCMAIDKENKAKVTMDLSEYESKTLSVKINNTLETDKYSADFMSSQYALVTVYGPEDVLSEISSSDVTVTTDYTKLLNNISSGSSVSLTVPLKTSLSEKYASSCWAYKLNDVKVNVTKK